MGSLQQLVDGGDLGQGSLLSGDVEHWRQPLLVGVLHDHHGICLVCHGGVHFGIWMLQDLLFAL